MQRFVLIGVFVAMSIFSFVLYCGVNPVDPAIDPGNADAQLFLDGDSTVFITEGDVRKIELRISYARHLEKIMLTSTCGVIDTVIVPDTGKPYDTVSFTCAFATSGKCVLTATAVYRNNTLKDKQRKLELYIEPSTPWVAFVKIPEPSAVEVGVCDTLLFVTQTKGSAASTEYTVSSIPNLDKTQLSILSSTSKDTVRILFNPAVADTYTVSVTATAQVPGASPVKATAQVGIRVYSTVAPSKTDIPQKILAGVADTLRFTVDNSTRFDKLTMKLVADKPLDAAIFTILPSSADSIVIAVAAGATAAAGTVKIGVSTSNGVITDTSWYPLTFDTTITELPVITTQPEPKVSVIEGQALTLTVVATGIPVPTFQWYKDDVLLTGQTNATFSKAHAAATDAGSYYVVCTNGSGTDVISTKAVVTIIVTPVYKVSFSLAGGTPAIPDQEVKQGEMASRPGSNPGKNGFAFAGWYKDDVFTTVFDFTTQTISQATVIYAKWIPVYTVTYDKNGAENGSAPVDSNNYKSGDLATVLGNMGNLMINGYEFNGWNTSADRTGAVKVSGDVITIGSAPVVLYAMWKRQQCTITFDGQEATTPPNPAVKAVDVSAAIGALPTEPKKTSYVFDGWYMGSNGEGTKISTATTFSVDDTVYAKWVIKDVDGNVYSEVTIGKQVWMVENLKTTRFNDGTGIPLVTDSAAWANLSSAGYCWQGNHPAWKEPFGALYNWFAISGKLAPEGWHVPTRLEFETLVNYLINNGYNWDDTKTDPKYGKALAATTYWDSSDTKGNIGCERSANNRTGFSALPGGGRDENGEFYYVMENGSWWQSDEWSINEGCFFGTYYYYSGFHYYCGQEKGTGLSVRCIRDQAATP